METGIRSLVHKFGWTLGVGDGQGGLPCCGLWGCKESHTTEQLNWTELNWKGWLEKSIDTWVCCPILVYCQQCTRGNCHFDGLLTNMSWSHSSFSLPQHFCDLEIQVLEKCPEVLIQGCRLHVQQALVEDMPILTEDRWVIDDLLLCLVFKI